jgi:hypothetical protein
VEIAIQTTTVFPVAERLKIAVARVWPEWCLSIRNLCCGEELRFFTNAMAEESWRETGIIGEGVIEVQGTRNGGFAKPGGKLLFIGEGDGFRSIVADFSSTADELSRFKKVPLTGRWRHWKGGEYEVLYEALETETGIVSVVYKSLKTGELFIRPRNNFLEEVPDQGPRFFRKPEKTRAENA